MKDRIPSSLGCIGLVKDFRFLSSIHSYIIAFSKLIDYFIFQNQFKFHDKTVVFSSKYNLYLFEVFLMCHILYVIEIFRIGKARWSLHRIQRLFSWFENEGGCIWNPIQPNATCNIERTSGMKSNRIIVNNLQLTSCLSYKFHVCCIESDSYCT